MNNVPSLVSNNAMLNEGLLLIEDAKILFRNFSGRPGEYNAEGERNFCVLLDPATVPEMQKQGWNVKFLRPREVGDEPQPYLQVKVQYFNKKGEAVRKPPRIVIVTSRGRTDIPMELVEMVDMVDLSKVDVTIRPYDWDIKGEQGRSAYLKTIVVTIQEDPLELKYAHVPVIGQGSALEGLPGQEPLAIEQAPNSEPPWDIPDGDIVDAVLVED